MRRISISTVTVALTVSLIVAMVGCDGDPVGHALIVSSTAGGSVVESGDGLRTYGMGPGPGCTSEEGIVVDLVAVADEGYRLVEWTGGYYVGGVGGNTPIGAVSNSFWDEDASGITESDGDTGKTTAEMMNSSTFNDTATLGLGEEWDPVPIPISTSPRCGQVGARIGVSGYEGTPDKQITFTWDGDPLATDPETVMTHESGYFSAYFVVPDVEYGDYAIRATDGEGFLAETIFSVGPAYTWSSPSEGPAGGGVYVHGCSFTLSSNVTVTWDGDPLATDPETVMTHESGSFYAYGVVPDVEYGDYTIRAIDGEGLWADTVFSVVPPYIECLPWSMGPAGSTFEIDGRAFTPESEISITWSGDPIGTHPEVVTADSYGRFWVDMIVPDVPDGEYTVRATDEEGLWAEAIFSVGPVTAIWLLPWQGTAGSSMFVIGVGFTPYSEFTITCDGDPISGSIDAYPWGVGIFVGEITVPDVSPGYHTIEVTDEEGHLAQALLNVVPRGISALPGGGAPGDWAFLSGSGFTENNEVEVTLDSEPVEAYGETDSRGQLWMTSIKVPDVPAGDYTMRATDEEGLWAETDFRVSQNGVVLHPSEGLEGSLVSTCVWDIPDDSAISITWDGELVESSTFLSEFLGLPGPCPAFIVPDVPAGDYVVRAFTGEQLWAETTFAVVTAPPTTGCFIATAAYGTTMAQEIQVLRDLRDGYLLTNPLGQAFVNLYYKTSPPIAEFITEHPSLKPIVRTALLPAVAMSTAVVNTTPAEKGAAVGLVVLISMTVAAWATKRRRVGRQNT